MLLAAAAITTSFFGARVVPVDELSPAGWCAVTAFVVVAATVLAVLWPWRDWEFNASPSDLIATYIKAASPATLAEIHRDMALHQSTSYTANAKLLGKLYWAFRVGLLLVAVEVAAWVVALSSHG